MLQSLFRIVLVNTKLCLIEVTSNKVRSFITTFGIFLGVASLLGMLSFIRGFQNQTTEQLDRMGGSRIISISSIKPENSEDEVLFGRSPGLRLAQVQGAALAVGGVEKIFPTASGPDRMLMARGKHSWGGKLAIGPGYFEEYNYLLSAGRSFMPEDFVSGRRVAVVGERIADRLFGGADSALNQKVMLGGAPFYIIGIIGARQKFDFRRSQFLYPYKVYEDQFAGHGSRLSKIDVKVSDVEDIERVKDGLESYLLSAHRGVRDFEIEMNTEKLEEQAKANMVMSLLLGAIASISLIVGGISIANIMFASIGERVREIGVRKSLGARKSDLFMQFLIEAVFLCFIGGFFGMVLGSVPSLLPKGAFPFEPELVVLDYVLALGVSVIVGCASGIFPAAYAANMEPVEALSYT